jgi:hypothetical protein
MKIRGLLSAVPENSYDHHHMNKSWLAHLMIRNIWLNLTLTPANIDSTFRHLGEVILDHSVYAKPPVELAHTRKITHKPCT